MKKDKLASKIIFECKTDPQYLKHFVTTIIKDIDDVFLEKTFCEKMSNDYYSMVIELYRKYINPHEFETAITSKFIGEYHFLSEWAKEHWSYVDIPNELRDAIDWASVAENAVAENKIHAIFTEHGTELVFDMKA